MKDYVVVLFSVCVIAAITFSLSLTSCYYDVQEDLHPESFKNCDTTRVSFSSTVSPFLQNNCVSCHTTGNTSGGVNLSGHANVLAVAQNGKLMGSLDHKTGYKPMPQGSQILSTCSRNIIRSWINAGSPNN